MKPQTQFGQGKDGQTDSAHAGWWRDHIDGLRAVSVLSVLFYHLSLPGTTGGFVGVDVFFVISGFLISKIIYSDITATGRFNIVDFYQRRARRIMPCYVVVTATTLILGLFLLLPDDLARLSVSSIYSNAFAANIYFFITSNYFAPNALSQPLLHYWSLGVEEQFYIFFPLLVLAVWKLSPRLLGTVICVVGALSLVAAEFYLRRDPPAAFYVSPLRAWELLAGSILALPSMRFPRDRIVREIGAGLGLLFILLAIGLYNHLTPFPGITAAMPVGGAALILWSCEKGRTWTGRLLSLKPLKHVGLWSYSIYMIHWPLIVYFNLFRSDNAAGKNFVVVTLSILLGWVSYRYVEAPFRRKQAMQGKFALFASSFAALVLLTSISAYIIQNDGLSKRLPKEVVAMLSYNNYPYNHLYREGVCFLRPEQGWSDLDQNACLEGKQILLWGDSHASHLYKSLQDQLAARGLLLSQATASSCPPIEGFEAPFRPACKSFNDNVLAWITRNRPKVVILSANWGNDANGLAELDKTMKKLEELDVRVVLLGPTPGFNMKVPTILAGRILRGESDQTARPGTAGLNLTSMDLMDERYGNRTDIAYISMKHLLMPDGTFPLITDNGVPVYWDEGHFTLEGEALAAKSIMQALDASVLPSSVRVSN